MNCLVCGKEIVGKQKTAKYCSKECGSKASNDRANAKSKAERHGKLKPKICVRCGQEFMPNIHGQHRIYCSFKCQNEVYVETNTDNGKRNIWRKKEYQNNKQDYLKRAKDRANQARFDGNYYKVLERDNYTCQHCGATDRKLEVHHKDGNGRGKEKPNNDLSNLITLCKPCHAMENAKYNTRCPLIPLTKEQIEAAIASTKTLKEAAELLGVSFPTLNHKKKKMGIYKGRQQQQA